MMVPFHPGPGITAFPPSLKTISNVVIGLGKAVLVIRTPPVNPVFQALLTTTSTVTPPADTATAAADSSVAFSGWPLQAARTRVSPRANDNRGSDRLVMMRSPLRLCVNYITPCPPVHGLFLHPRHLVRSSRGW